MQSKDWHNFKELNITKSRCWHASSLKRSKELRTVLNEFILFIQTWDDYSNSDVYIDNHSYFFKVTDIWWALNTAIDCTYEKNSKLYI